MTRSHVMSGLAMAATIAAVGTAVADSWVIVQGKAVYEDRNGKSIAPQPRDIGLYRTRKKLKLSHPVITTSDQDGSFTLKANWQLEGDEVFVIDEEQAALPRSVILPHAGDGPRMREKIVLRLTRCNLKKSVETEDLGACITASGVTQSLKARLGAVSMKAADDAFRERTSNLFMNVSRWKEADVQSAFAALDQYLGRDRLPPLPSATDGGLLQKARQILATRETHCRAGVTAAETANGYVAFGDRCEGDTAQLTSARPHLISLTQGSPRLDDGVKAAVLSWTPSDHPICLTAQPLMSDGTSTALPQWRMTRRAQPRDGQFVWDPARARALGVDTADLGFLAQRCDEPRRDQLQLIPVRIAAAASNDPFRFMIRGTRQVREVDVVVTDVRDDGWTETARPKAQPFSRQDPQPRIWVEIPSKSKGPGTLSVSVQLHGDDKRDDPEPVLFSFRRGEDSPAIQGIK